MEKALVLVLILAITLCMFAAVGCEDKREYKYEEKTYRDHDNDKVKVEKKVERKVEYDD